MQEKVFPLGPQTWCEEMNQRSSPECCSESGYWAPPESTHLLFCHSRSRLGHVSVWFCYTDTLLICAQSYWNLWPSRRTSGSTSGSRAEPVRTVGWWTRTAWWSVNSPTEMNLRKHKTIYSNLWWKESPSS